MPGFKERVGVRKVATKGQLNSRNENSPMRKGADEHNRRFSKEDIEMVDRGMERCSTSLMQIKTTKINHLTPVRVATLRRQVIKRAGEDVETLMNCWWECKLVQPQWKTVWGFLKILKMEILYDPVIPPPGIYPKEMKTEETPTRTPTLLRH